MKKYETCEYTIEADEDKVVRLTLLKGRTLVLDPDLSNILQEQLKSLSESGKIETSYSSVHVLADVESKPHLVTKPQTPSAKHHDGEG